MSVPFVPHRFNDLGNLHLEKANDNLKKIARDIKKNQDARYTYSRSRFPLDGLTDAAAQALRQFAIRRPSANAGVEIVGIELVIIANDASVWTLSCSDTTWPSFTVTDKSSVSTESSNSADVAVSVPSFAADVVFTLSASAASTITRGHLVVHWRCDRGNQGDTFTGYTPALLNSASSDAGSTLDTELTAAETAVVCDTNADKDVRIEIYAVRSLLAASSKAWRVPASSRRRMAFVGYTVQAAGSVDFTVDGTTKNVAAGGAGVRATGTQSLSGSQSNDPLNSASDSLVTILANGSTADLAYLCLFWS